jgi:glycosyltransferase involved in cell wall biosynthesis
MAKPEDGTVWIPPKVTRPEVSVVLPTRNGEVFIRESIESVVGQTEGSLELIVVLDGCTDGTEDIVRDFLRHDGRIGMLVFQENRGLPRALNAGFDVARGRLYSWTSDDNSYYPTAIEDMKNVIEAHAADVVLGGMEIVSTTTKYRREYIPDRIENLATDNIAGACFLYQSYVHRSLGGYDPRAFLAEDYDFFLRAYCQGYRFCITPKILYRYRRHEHSLSTRFSSQVGTVRDRVILRSLARLPDADGKTRCYTGLQLARRFWRRNEYRYALICLGLAVRYSPRIVMRDLREVAKRKMAGRIG